MEKKIFATSVFVIVSFVSLFFWQEQAINDGRLHIIFCNVGQGDAIFIRTPNKTDILLDGGPDRRVLDCLASHMPFWDRTLEFIILSHPHQDHFAGLIDVLESYTVLSFATEKLGNESAGYKVLMDTLKSKNIEIKDLFSGNVIKTSDGVRLSVLSPSEELLERTSPGGQIGESGEFGSIIAKLAYGEFEILFTSDSQARQMREASEVGGQVDILQVPHHGSKTGLDSDIIEGLSPKVAVISVGKNRYGHPHKETMKILTDKEIEILRTDQNGEIELISDGKGFKIEVDFP